MRRLSAAIAVLNGTADWSNATEAQRLAFVKCRAMMVGYDAHWGGPPVAWKTLSTEERVTLPLVNPKSLRASRNWNHQSIHDGVIERVGDHNGGRSTFLLEHKTTSSDIGPGSSYWKRLKIDGQVSKYEMDRCQAGEKARGTLYDVIRKPGIKPKKLTKANRIEIVHSGSYLSRPVSDLAIDAVENDLLSENFELYEIRLQEEVRDKPERYYARQIVYRLEHEIAEYADELWQIGKEISSARLKGRHYRNTAACQSFGRTCEYLPFCAGEEDPPPSPKGFERSNTLSHSQISVFQTCRRKYFYHYELGLKRQEETEALYIGSLMHRALEAWWVATDEGEDDGG